MKVQLTSLWNVAKAVLRGTSIAVNAYIINPGRAQMSKSNSNRKTVDGKK